MERVKRSWKQIPDKPRRVLTFIVGILLILTSVLIGWIPGPGGMIPFLLGIAVLATEFSWAERFRDWVLETLKKMGRYIKVHRSKSLVALIFILGLAGVIAYAFYTKIM